MSARETKCLHLLLGLLGAPALFLGYLIGSDLHSSAVFTAEAVYKHLGARVATKQREETRENCIFRERTVPGYCDILHPKLRHLLPLAS